MRIGSTPRHSFTLPFGEEFIAAIEITYCQSGKIVLQKTGNDCTISGNTVSVDAAQFRAIEDYHDICG